jgi:hypothetical protein
MSDDEEQPVIKLPPREEPGKRFFLSHANTHEGMTLFRELYNRDKCREPEHAAHTFIATVKNSERTASNSY